MAATVYSYSENDDWLSIYLKEHERLGTYTLSTDNSKLNPVIQKQLDTFYKLQSVGNEEGAIQILQGIITLQDVHIVNKPQIEEALEPMKKVYEAMRLDTFRPDDMLIIDTSDEADFKEEWGMSSDKFIGILENDIIRFKLDNVVEQSFDGGIYVYPALRDAFTHSAAAEQKLEKILEPAPEFQR